MTSYAINLLQRRTKSIQNIVFDVDFIDLPVSCYCWLGPDIILFENVLAQRHDIAANEMEWSRLLFKWHSSLKTANFDFLSKKNQSIRLWLFAHSSWQFIFVATGTLYVYHKLQDTYYLNYFMSWNEFCFYHFCDGVLQLFSGERLWVCDRYYMRPTIQTKLNH